MRRLLIALAVMLSTACEITIFGVGMDEVIPATPGPASTATFAPTSVPAISLLSGGLGLSKAEWEQAHRQTDTDFLGPIYDEYYIVMFANEHVSYIERQWATPVTSQDAEAEGAMLVPSDAVRMEAYSPDGRPETIVILYTSEYLKTQFADEQFVGGEAGNFTLQYNVFDGVVTRMIVALGNNP
ncbi:MAG: hypothetical protein ACT4QE_15540 [Anaerolineales bacterium]